MLLSTPLIISNNILELAFKDNIKITPMKLQRLIYLVYKDYLKVTNNQLFSERFEVWKNGAVLVSVYYHFRNYAENGIDTFYENSFGNAYKLKTEKMFYQSLIRVWGKYRNVNGIDLSKLLIQNGTAWNKAWINNYSYLDNLDILKESFDL